jgi:hypothetical protein
LEKQWKIYSNSKTKAIEELDVDLNMINKIIINHKDAICILNEKKFNLIFLKDKVEMEELV